MAADAGDPVALADWKTAGFGVYVHWPFCQAKCPYCDFNSHVVRSVDHAAWADALVAEARHMRGMTGTRPVDTIFFGGGTPSLMEPSTVEQIIRAIDDLWGIAPGAEITLEANPTSVEADRFRGYAAAGVNRVSLGVQALNDDDLRALGRLHSAAEARAAFDIARAVFDRISFDLIYARMGQTVSAWEAELSTALDLAADHLSLYQLTIEPGTRFAELHARGRLIVPGEDPSAEMYDVTAAMTEATGLPAYEVSNHASPGAESRHNLIYWKSGDWAGIGPGAHGRVTAADGVRYATETARDPGLWRQRVAEAGQALTDTTPLDDKERAEELLLMGLRLSEGVDPSRYARLSGQPLDPDRIAPLVADGLLLSEPDRLRATRSGRLVLNSVLADLLA